MPPRQLPSGEEWKFGSDPPMDHELVALIEANSKADLSAARLTRAVQVVTVEHLAWSSLALWAVITRFLQLGKAPLAPYEARHALFEYDLLNGTDWASATGYHPVSGGWVHLVEAGVFAMGGANDIAARLIFVLMGLSMIAIAFLMRPLLGRAGAIAAATLITVSPTFTYFSRASAIAIVAAALAMVVIESFLAFVFRPSLRRAIVMGCVSGLLCETGSTGLATGGILLVALVFFGLCQLIVTDRAYLNVRIWLRRYGWTLVPAIVVGSLSWVIPQIGLSSFSEIAKAIATVWNGFGAREYSAGLLYYAPAFLLYEFLIIPIAIAGLITIFSLRAWSRSALFSLVWLVISFTYFLGSRERESDRLVVILLPLVIVGALGTDYLHHTRAWPYARGVLIALVAASVYVQIVANFIYAAPVASETPWTRHANLYWQNGATTIEARAQLSKIWRQFPEGSATVLNSGIWQPSLRWYLRSFRPTNSAKMAGLVINPNPPASAVQESDLDSPSVIDLEESWDPALGTLTLVRAMRFMFTAAPWTSLRREIVAILERPSLDLAPTLIIPPSPH
jgi:predicted membrane-bound mannosyltransferase